MQQFFLRHGLAMDPTDPDCPADPLRPLTDEGKKRTRRVAKGMVHLKLRVDRIWSSPYLRALQTAEIAAKELGFPADRIELTEELEPDADPFQLALRLRDVQEQILCVGHAPILDGVVAVLVGSGRPVTALKKAGLAVLEAASATEPGRLQAVYEPKTLADLGD